MIQQSLFPEEVPHKEVKETSRRQDYYRYLRRYLEVEGPYKLAKMAQEILAASDEMVLHHHKMPKQELYGMCEAVFGEKYVWQETLATFLERTRNEENYGLTEYIMKDEKPIRKKVNRGRR